MITIIARFQCQEGKEEEGFAALKKMVNAVKDNETGADAYLCHRSEENPREIVFYEVYKDEESFKAHGQTDHMKAMNLEFMKYFAPPVKIEKLERIEGFMRG